MTSAEITVRIAEIDVRIGILLGKNDYKAGEYSVSYTKQLTELRKLRAYYASLKADNSYEEMTIWRDY